MLKTETKTEKAMLGYIDRNQNVVAIEPSWNLGAPEDMGKFLLEKYPTKEDAIKIVDTAISLPKFRKDDYWYVDGLTEAAQTAEDAPVASEEVAARQNFGGAHLSGDLFGVIEHLEGVVSASPMY